MGYPVYGECHRFKRNIASLRAAFQGIVDARKSGSATGSLGEHSDLLDVLLTVKAKELDNSDSQVID